MMQAFQHICAIANAITEETRKRRQLVERAVEPITGVMSMMQKQHERERTNIDSFQSAIDALPTPIKPCDPEIRIDVH